jgi:thiol-disulfide isomerase/thioredoxin
LTSTRRAALAALSITVLAGCSEVGATDTGRVVEIAPDDREDALALSGSTLDGNELDVADLRGSPVVLNVWWSGCGPCRREMPLLNEVAKDSDAAFVGINMRDVSEANARSFERDVGVEYPSFYPGGELLLHFGSYTPVALPTTVVLDSKGRVAAIVPGEMPSAGTLEDLIAAVDLP